MTLPHPHPKVRLSESTKCNKSYHSNYRNQGSNKHFRIDFLIDSIFTEWQFHALMNSDGGSIRNVLHNDAGLQDVEILRVQYEPYQQQIDKHHQQRDVLLLPTKSPRAM